MSTKQLSARPPVEMMINVEETFNSRPDFMVRAPGRVELLGCHTDYNDGWVLSAAINRYAWLAVKKMPATLVIVRALDMGNEEVAFRLTELDEKTTLTGEELPDWSKYAAGVAWSLQEAGLATPGSRLAISSQIPIGAGLASSAAVETAYATAWAHITGWEIEKMELAVLCQRAESRYIGLRAGLKDQFACLFGRRGHVLLFDCRTYEWKSIGLPGDIVLVVADTGTRLSAGNNGYEQRFLESREATTALQRYIPGVRALRDVSIEQFQEYAEEIPEPARQRAQHIIEENERVQAGTRALQVGEVEILGELMDQSYISARDLLDVSSPELDAMWLAGQDHPARLGGRVLGDGWAGSLLFLVRADGVDDFIKTVETGYFESTGLTPTFYQFTAADGTQVVSVQD
ncbi:MAG: galactokinase [Anaerolineae bacterium]|nr:galactokinase [Anaerolineae bacterium]